MSECLSDTQAGGILNLPHEILVKIILHFDPKERLALAESCQRFYNLVFKDAELLRDLDYSKYQKCLTATDIRRYFGNEESRRLVRRLNIEYNNCLMRQLGGRMVRDLIGQAMNLVDVNILGQNFGNIKELRKFLEPLVHVKRLSVKWPHRNIDDVHDCRTFLATRFSKLTYLSTEICLGSADEFLSILQSCTELEELRLFLSGQDNEVNSSSMFYRLDASLNKNLKIIYLHGAILYHLRRRLISTLPDPSKWTEIRGFDVYNRESYYFEKKMKLCKKLRDTVFEVSESGLVLVSNRSLLKAVIKITHEDTPDEFHCLPDDDACVLNIDEAKRLLRDSGYQISYLNAFPKLDYDAHLIASAFDNITKLGSSGCGRNVLESRRRSTQSQTGLKKRGTDMTIRKSYDPPCEMFVENTPNLRELDMSTPCSVTHETGFGSQTLRLISRWKFLRVLRLWNLQVKDAAFLIDIGKNCQELEILDLHRNWSRDSHAEKRCTDDVLKMLNIGCRNLKEFMIEDNMPHSNELLKAVSKNLNPRKVKIIAHYGNEYDLGAMESIEQLIRGCPKLNELIFGKVLLTRLNEFESALQRAKVKLNRPDFQFYFER